MLAASQEIDSFIERQRSKLNKQPSQVPINRQPTFQQPINPPPPPRQPSYAPNNIQDRLDFKVARILDEPPPRIQPQQPFYPSSSPPFNHNPMSEQQMNYIPEQQQQQQQHRRSSFDNNDNNPASFFNRFGTYDDKRTQLKDDLKREYNEYLQAQRGIPKSKSSSQLISPRGNTNKRVQFQQQQQQQQQNGKVVAPWEKNDNKSATNIQNMNNTSSTLTSTEYAANRSRTQTSLNHDEQFIRDREGYILELHTQIRELEGRRKQLETDGTRLSSGGTTMVTRAHYNEDLNALNSLLAERLDQRNAIDHELAHILKRPPVSSSPTRVVTGGISNLNLLNDHSQQISSQGYQQQNGRYMQTNRNENRSGTNDNGFQIGRESDKDAEQTAKKRYQQELQGQMREAQMRKVQAKQDKDEYERKIDADIQRYNYFGRGGGGAPMRDKDGNVVANLADVRNPPPPSLQQQQQQQPPPSQHRQQQSYYPPDDKVYSLGNGLSSLTNPPFYNGEQQQYSSNSDRPGSPNHARGAVNNGIFGTAKTDEQIGREEKYKQELKTQMDDKRRRDAEEKAKRRAEEDREIAKHLEWQQQMEKQVTEDALRKQEKEDQDRLHHLKSQEEKEERKRQEELIAKRKPKRQDKPTTPRNDDDNKRQISYDEPAQPPPRTDVAYRSSSPPVPTLKNKDKKQKSNTNNTRRPSSDEVNQQHALPSFDNNDDYIPPPAVDDNDGHGRQTYRKPPTPRQPDITSARKKTAQTYRSRPRLNSNSGIPIRNNSAASLRSDGSDSEVLNRLEHLKRQLKDREARLQEHVSRHQVGQSINTGDHSKNHGKQSPGFLINAPRVHHRDSPTTNDIVRRILQTDDDAEFKPSYFRDDTILLGGAGKKNDANTDSEFFASIKRLNSSNRKFNDDIEKQTTRSRYDHNPSKFYDQEDPTSMANYELNRIAKQNEQRLKKLRDLENDDASLLDSNEVLERFQQKQRLQRGGSQTTLQDDAWLK